MSDTRISTAIDAGEHPILLQDQAQTEAAEAEWSQHDALGLDTEFVRERTYRADLGLVQISNGEKAWLVDPLEPGTHPALQRLLSNQGIVKIFHSASEDLEVLWHSLGELPRPLVDTQVALALLGQPLQLGYHHAIRDQFGVELDKDQTRSNWVKRPLTPRQLHYAAMDVVLLPALYESLRERLGAMGRWEWLVEETDRMLTQAQREVDPDQAWLRVGGSGRLSTGELRVLRALAAWRERTAIAKNRARGFVIKDSAMMQIARVPADAPDPLRDIDDIHPNQLRRIANPLMQALEEGRADTRAISAPEPLKPAQRQQMKALRDAVQHHANALSVDPALLASRKQLEAWLRASMAGEPPPARFQGWRKEVLAKDLEKALNS